MLTLNSHKIMDELDLNISEDILLMRSSRTATFTLSSSLSSSYSNIYDHSNMITTSNRCVHSQSIRINNRQRRPTIHDPYQLIVNLQALNDWMIVSFSHLIR